MIQVDLMLYFDITCSHISLGTYNTVLTLEMKNFQNKSYYGANIPPYGFFVAWSNYTDNFL